MATAAKKAVKEKQPSVVDLFSSQRAATTISKTHTTELVIALCGPIGSPLHEVASAIEDMLVGQLAVQLFFCKYFRAIPLG
jgi:hypothetical protein